MSVTSETNTCTVALSLGPHGTPWGPMGDPWAPRVSREGPGATQGGPRELPNFACGNHASSFARRLSITIGEAHDRRAEIGEGMKIGRSCDGEGMNVLLMRCFEQHGPKAEPMGPWASKGRGLSHGAPRLVYNISIYISAFKK